MPVPSRAYSRCAERGVAVIMAMLTVALVAALAAAVLAEFGASVDSVSGRRDLAQARWLARGAIDWARNVLAEDKRTTKTIDYIGEPWSTRVPPTEVEEGEVSGEIDDLSGRFNLNSVINNNGTSNDKGKSAYARLLQQVAGLSQAKAEIQAKILAEWLRFAPDPGEASAPAAASEEAHFAAPLPLVDELVNVPGFDAGILEKLRPFVAALPPDSKLNLNTASAEVLFASFKNLTIDQARAIVAGRTIAWFKDTGDFNGRFGNTASTGTRYEITADTNLHAVGSCYFLASGRARFGSATTRMQVLLDRCVPISPGQQSSNWPKIIWQRIL